jgi:hypothetical protein
MVQVPPPPRGLAVTGVIDDEHPVFQRPAPDQLLWRYVDLSKFVSMLKAQSVWFSRADLLGDPFEGSMSRANLEVRPALYDGRIPEASLRQIVETRRAAVRHAFISCWHESDWESAAMWRLYMRDHGIAVVTTYERMRQSFVSDHQIYIGRVRYVDYERDFIDESNALSPFMHKRRSFEHEREVRAVVSTYPLRPAQPGESGNPTGEVLDYSLPSPSGMAVSADLAALVSEIRVAPDAPEWFATAVAGVAERYGLTAPVHHSDLGGDPVY